MAALHTYGSIADPISRICGGEREIWQHCIWQRRRPHLTNLAAEGGYGSILNMAASPTPSHKSAAEKGQYGSISYGNIADPILQIQRRRGK